MIKPILMAALAAIGLLGGIRFRQFSHADVQALARIVWWEARGDSPEGQLAVANVVLNRVESEAFPDSVEAVIGQKGQFSPAAHPDYFRVAIPPEMEEVALQALLGQQAVCCENVVYFSVGQADYMQQPFRLGGHVFGHRGPCCSCKEE